MLEIGNFWLLQKSSTRTVRKRIPFKRWSPWHIAVLQNMPLGSLVRAEPVLITLITQTTMVRFILEILGVQNQPFDMELTRLPIESSLNTQAPTHCHLTKITIKGQSTLKKVSRRMKSFRKISYLRPLL